MNRYAVATPEVKRSPAKNRPLTRPYKVLGQASLTTNSPIRTDA